MTIPQDLYEHYLLLRQSGVNLPQPGWATQQIGYVLVIRDGGELVDVICKLERRSMGKKPKTGEKKSFDMATLSLALPSQASQRSGSNPQPNFLWDNPAYALGLPGGTAEKCHKAFIALHETLLAETAKTKPEARALLDFLGRTKTASNLPIDEETKEAIIKSKANVTFMFQRPDGRRAYLYETLGECWDQGHGKVILNGTRDYLDFRGHDKEKILAMEGLCAVTGKKGLIARLHPPVKGINGAPTASTYLSSFNAEPATTQGVQQNFNAPVDKDVAFGIVTALNYILAQKNQCVTLGDTKVAIWASKTTPTEKDDGIVAGLVAINAPRTFDARVAENRAAYIAKMAGKKRIGGAEPIPGANANLHILGLSPNSSRLSVRFYHNGPASALETLRRSAEWYEDLRIEKRSDNTISPPPTLEEIVEAILGPHADSQKGYSLCTQLMESALTGGKYPAQALSMCMDGVKKAGTVSYIQAGLIKAILKRNYKEEIEMSLDRYRADKPYLLGRLFALIEQTQKAALGKVCLGIGRKYLRSAGTHPAKTFPQLVYNLPHYLAMEPALTWAYKKEIEAIFSLMDAEGAYPDWFSTKDQGIFQVGYYHQLGAINADIAARHAANEAKANKSGNIKDVAGKELEDE